MTRFLFAFSLLCLALTGYAQVAPQAAYLLFNNQNMDILDYRLAYSSNTTQYYAYNLRPGGNDQYILYTGGGVNMDYLPSNTQNSRDFAVTDEMITGVNNVTRQLFVVIQQQRGYIVAPVTSITKITTSGKYLFVNALRYSYVFDTDNISMGRELSTAGSGSSVSITSFGYKSCKYQYSFKRMPNTANGEAAEFDYIPGIGIISERSGRNASEMQANQINLWGINGLALNDYIARECGTNATPTPTTPPVTTPLPGNIVAPTDPRLGDPATGIPTAAPAPAGSNVVMVSAISNYPATNCGKQAAAGMHIVQPKETVNSIARFYGVTAANILKWNGIKDANKISICQELRIAAPGGTIPKGRQPIIAATVNQPATGVTVTPPPSAPPATGNYNPVQPSQPAVGPGMFNPQGGSNYQTPQPVVPTNNPTIAAGTTTAANQVQYYDVKPGEGVAAIARKFGYTEERFRTMNNMPMQGNVPLQVGQKLKVADCEHGVYHSPSALPAATTTVPNLTPPAGTQPAATGTQYQPLPAIIPVTSSTTPTVPAGFVPVTTNPIGTQPAVTTPEIKTTPKRDPIGFKDYFVKDSETLKDIARKQGMDPSELGLINGRDQNEKLAPGTRIQLPIY